MIPISYRKLRGVTIRYDFKIDNDKTNILTDATTKDLHLQISIYLIYLNGYLLILRLI